MRAHHAFTSFLLAAASLSLHAQQLTARDAFWSASDLVSVASNSGSKPHAAAHTHKAVTPHVPAPAGAAAPPDTGATSPEHVNPTVVAQSGYGAEPHLSRVSSTQIGLRYSLLERDQDGQYVEVSPKKIFHNGDRIRLSLMANQPGYLYVVAKGSTGAWKPIFPAPGSAPESNHVQQGQLYMVPSAPGAFEFDRNPGEEKLFVIVSRRPIADLDSTIERLKTGSAAPQREAPGDAGQVLEASNRIPDELMQRFGSRDLNLVEDQQEVGAQPTEENSGEKAVYVVAKATRGAEDPQVVAPVTLVHE